MAPTLDHPLRHASYRWLLAGVPVNSPRTGVPPVALAFAVLDLGGDASDLGVVVGLYALADVAAVLFGGVLGDRLPRTVMMQGSSALAAVTQGLVAASLVGGWSSIPLLAAPGMVNGALGALGGPSSSAITQQTVPAELLRTAITWRRISQNVAVIVGSGAAGLLVAGPGSGWSGGRRRKRLGAGRRRVPVRVRGGVLPAGSCRAAGRTGGARKHGRRRPRGLHRGYAAHVAVAADPAGPAVPPVLRRGAGRARPDRGRRLAGAGGLGLGAVDDDARVRPRRPGHAAVETAARAVRRH